MKFQLERAHSKQYIQLYTQRKRAFSVTKIRTLLHDYIFQNYILECR